jgi:hypothetical protein
MSDPQTDDLNDAELARWLQEAGRRRVVRKPDASLPQVIGASVSGARKRHVRNPRTMTLLAIAALAYLPYFFADVYVQISSLPCIIVFV